MSAQSMTTSVARSAVQGLTAEDTLTTGSPILDSSGDALLDSDGNPILDSKDTP